MSMEALSLTRANVMEYIERRKHVSMVELVHHFEGAGGDCNFGDPGFNLVFWSGVSEELIQIVSELLKAGDIYARGTSLLTYLADGGLLRLPLAKRANWKYKSLRWFPIALEPISMMASEPAGFQADYASAREAAGLTHGGTVGKV